MRDLFLRVMQSSLKTRLLYLPIISINPNGTYFISYFNQRAIYALIGPLIVVVVCVSEYFCLHAGPDYPEWISYYVAHKSCKPC